MDLNLTITRRNTLKGASTITAAAAIPAAAAGQLTGYELVQFHLDGLKTALEAARGGAWNAHYISENTVLLMGD